jgi:hypothetical protein
MNLLKHYIASERKRMSTMSKRGQMVAALQSGPTLIILLVVMGIVGAIGLRITTDVGTGFTGAASSAIANITSSIQNFFKLTPVLGTVLIATVLLAAVVGLLVFAGRSTR